LTPSLFVFRGDGEPEEIRVEGEGHSWRITRQGKTLSISAAWLPDGRLSLLLPDGRQICGRVAPDPERGEVEVVTAAGAPRVPLTDPLRDRLAHPSGTGSEAGDEEVRALMPGRIVEVRVSEGQSVEAGDVLIVLEAMKMQNEIRASSNGRVVRCSVAPGQAVEGRSLLLLIHSSPNP
jgi:biotin carboxyl carrier protein